MISHSMMRGHPIEFRDGVWVYADTGEPSASALRRACGHCGMQDTPEGHDGCLGTLPGVMNACCGHGVEAEAYVQRWDGECVRGAEATAIVAALRQQGGEG